MDQKMHDKGLEVRKAVLGEAYVNNALKNVDDFNKPFQDLLNEYCWGSVWGREELPRKTRSMLNIAMISILNRPHELRAHLRGALTNGVTRDEIREILMQVAIYGGMPAAVDSFRIAREVFAEIDKALTAQAFSTPSLRRAERRSNPDVSAADDSMDCFAASLRNDEEEETHMEIGFIGLGKMGFPDGAPPDRGRASARRVRHAEGSGRPAGRRSARRRRRRRRMSPTASRP